MLGKLLKYEIPALGRKLVPLYVGWAVTAVLLGVMVGPLAEKSEFMLVISAMLYAGVATAVFVMTMVMIVQRYSSSLLGNGGYFAHVLPVTASEHIGSKTIAAIVWTTLSFVAMMITGILILLFSGNISDLFKYDWAGLFRVMFLDAELISWVVLIEFIIVTILGSAKSILAIYAALTIGHQAKKHTTLASIGAYLAVLTFESFAVRIVLAIAPFLFKAPETTGQVALLLFVAGIVTIIIGGFYFYICKYMMEKKLDLG